MRNDMLYIDGQLVDLDDNTKITLNIKSNLLTDISKIVGNNTYSIKLPMTVRNRRIIENADVPACGTNYPRQIHQARYFRNGVEILSDAQAVLLSITDTIDISLVWGNSTAFGVFVSDGLKLRDLNDTTAMSAWEKGFSSAQPKIDYGFVESEENATYHPAVTVKWVLDRIQADSGLTFVFPADRQTMLSKMILPLIERNDCEKWAKNAEKTLEIISTPVWADNKHQIYFKALPTNASYYGYIELNYGNVYTIGYHSSISNGKPKIDGTIELTYVRDGSNVPLFVVYSYNMRDGSLWETRTVYERVPDSIEELNATHNKAVYTISDDELEVLDKGINYGVNGESIRFGFEYGQNKVVSISGTLKLMNIAEMVKLRQPQGLSYTDGRYPYVANLPDMKQIDFIKAISQMLGLFAIADGNVINFIPIGNLVVNKSKAVDWTKKVVATYIENRPRELSYVLDDFAQNNRFIYQTDDTVSSSYDGVVRVNDATIDYESDAVKLPFAASDTKNGIARIPIYSYDKDGVLEYDDGVKPRILLLSGSKGVFKGLEWPTLIDKYYLDYSSFVKHPKVIVEKIEIDEISLKNIDVTVPVYLAQYGRYYAIINIKAENTGICECKLLEL